MEALGAYISEDRRLAMAGGEELPDRATGAVLFADISGFTRITESLVQALGPNRGAEVLSRHLNTVYGVLVKPVHRYRGSIVNFTGDGIICWFNDDDGRRAVASGLAMLQAMTQYKELKVLTGVSLPLALKVGVASGSVRRLRVGNPRVQYIDVLAGAVVGRVAKAEQCAVQGQLVVDADTAAKLGDDVEITGWCGETQSDRIVVSSGFAIVTRLRGPVEPTPWPTPNYSKNLISGEWRLTEGQVRPWLLPPVYERLRRGQARFLDEIRPVAALFLKFSGLEYDQDNRVGEKLDAYICWVQNILARHQGYLIQLTTGDKGSYLYAAFGAPTAHEGHIQQAIGAALELRSPPPEMGFITKIQIGLSTGLMHSGPYGAAVRRTYGVLGNETNMAALLMDRATNGQILATGGVAIPANRDYRIEQLHPIHLRDNPELIPVFEILGRRWTPEKKLGVEQHPTIVGREAELALLTQKLHNLIKTGTGGTVIIEGEAGIGKSRLVTELRTLVRKQGLTELMGAGQSIERQIPYHAWRDIFITYFNLKGAWQHLTPGSGAEQAMSRQHQAQVRAHVEAIAPEQIERLPLLNDVLNLELPDSKLTNGLNPALRQQGLAVLLVTLLRAWAKDQPLVIILDDAHWLDSLSWELTNQVVRSLLASDDSLLLIVATRPLDVNSPEAGQMASLKSLAETTTISLSSLTTNETAALVTARLGLSPGALPETVANLVYQRAEGNPFFAEELTQTLLDRDLIRVEPEAQSNSSGKNGIGLNRCLITGDLVEAELALTGTVQSLILARIDRLPPEAQLTLKVAAVIGRTFGYTPLRYTLGHHIATSDVALKSQLNLLISSDLTALENFLPELTYIFKHIITQEVAYQTLVLGQRRELHHLVADWYERAYIRQDGSAVPKSQVPSFVYSLLVHHYRHAGLHQREQYYARLAGEHAAAQFANQEAIAYFNRALDLTPADNHTDRYTLLLAREKVFSVQGQREPQLKTLMDLQELADIMNDDTKRAEVALRWSAYAEAISDYAVATAAARSAVNLAQAIGNATLEAEGYLNLGQVYWRQGDYPEAERQLNQALGLTANMPRLQARSLRRLGLVAWHRGDYTTARKFFEMTLLIFQEIGDRQGEGVVLNNLGIIAAEQGDPDRAQSFFEQSLLICHQVGDRKLEANVLNNLGIVEGRSSDYITARIHYERALRIKREIDDRQGEAMVLDNLGDVSRYQGLYAQARTFFEESLRIRVEMGERLGEANVINNLGNVAHYLGDYAAAKRYYDQSLALRQEIGDRQGEGETLAYLSLLYHHLGDQEFALDYGLQAFEIVDSLGDRHLQGYALTHLGHALAGLQMMPEAAEKYQQALALRRELGEHNRAMEPLAGLARVALARGNLDEAQTYVEEILNHLEQKALDGTEEPLRIYLTCYRVLSSTGQDSRAQVIKGAHQLLQEQAANLTDTRLKQSFLENVAVHKAIIEALKL